MTLRSVPLPARTDVSSLALRAVTEASRAAADRAGVEGRAPDPARVAVAYSSERWMRLDGSASVAFAPLSGFFATADGWVRTHANYPHHAAALRHALRLSPGAQREEAAEVLRSVQTAVAVRDISAAGGLCVECRREVPHADRRLREDPLVSTTRLAATPPVGAGRPTAAAPLHGIRVLDLTRVIAGPIATRTLALLGADVLRIDPPRLAEPPWQHLDTGHAKRSTLLDLAHPTDRRTFDGLLETADVVVLGYRPAALDRLGLSPAALAARRPGLVVGRLTAWGTPDRRGFDSLVQAESGIAWVEMRDDGSPGALPAQALDHSAGYLLAAGIIRSLDRRAAEGGSWLVETSLRRIAAELLGSDRALDPEPAGGPDPEGHLQTFVVDGQEVVTAAPAIAYAGAPEYFSAPRPWGADVPSWAGRG